MQPLPEVASCKDAVVFSLPAPAIVYISIRGFNNPLACHTLRYKDPDLEIPIQVDGFINNMRVYTKMTKMMDLNTPSTI